MSSAAPRPSSSSTAIPGNAVCPLDFSPLLRRIPGIGKVRILNLPPCNQTAGVVGYVFFLYEGPVVDRSRLLYRSEVTPLSRNPCWHDVDCQEIVCCKVSHEARESLMSSSGLMAASQVSLARSPAHAAYMPPVEERFPAQDHMYSTNGSSQQFSTPSQGVTMCTLSVHHVSRQASDLLSSQSWSSIRSVASDSAFNFPGVCEHSMDTDEIFQMNSHHGRSLSARTAPSFRVAESPVIPSFSFDLCTLLPVGPSAANPPPSRDSEAVTVLINYSDKLYRAVLQPPRTPLQLQLCDEAPLRVGRTPLPFLANSSDSARASAACASARLPSPSALAAAILNVQAKAASTPLNNANLRRATSTLTDFRVAATVLLGADRASKLAAHREAVLQRAVATSIGNYEELLRKKSRINAARLKVLKLKAQRDNIIEKLERSKAETASLKASSIATQTAQVEIRNQLSRYDSVPITQTRKSRSKSASAVAVGSSSAAGLPRSTGDREGEEDHLSPEPGEALEVSKASFSSQRGSKRGSPVENGSFDWPEQSSVDLQAVARYEELQIKLYGRKRRFVSWMECPIVHVSAEAQHLSYLVDRLRMRIEVRSATLMSELSQVYPIVMNPDPKIGCTIADISFPPIGLKDMKDKKVVGSVKEHAAALGALAHLVILLSDLYNVPLRYTIDFQGSWSNVIDETHQGVVHPFPLYPIRDSIPERYARAQVLMNVNVVHLACRLGRQLSSSNMDILANVAALLECAPDAGDSAIAFAAASPSASATL